MKSKMIVLNKAFEFSKYYQKNNKRNKIIPLFEIQQGQYQISEEMFLYFLDIL
jgi:hypothetical protein